MKLFTYWRSTTCYRVRIALNLKKIDYSSEFVSLIKDGGQHKSAEYLSINNFALVPSLMLEDGTVLNQSLAIIQYLDTLNNDKSNHYSQLIPDQPLLKAKVMAAAHTIAMEVHPINNMRVCQQLTEQFGATPEQKTEWMRYWINLGFTHLEKTVDPLQPFAFTNTPTLADICIVSQVYNARRWQVDMTQYPELTKIETNALKMDAFIKAMPENQKDANT